MCILSGIVVNLTQYKPVHVISACLAFPRHILGSIQSAGPCTDAPPCPAARSDVHVHAEDATNATWCEALMLQEQARRALASMPSGGAGAQPPAKGAAAAHLALRKASQLFIEIGACV